MEWKYLLLKLIQNRITLALPFLFMLTTQTYADLYTITGYDDGVHVNGKISTNSAMGEIQDFIYKTNRKDIFSKGN